MITVAIVSYKYGHLVAQAIESVLCQTLKPEILVVDDAVGDVEEVAKKYPVKFILRDHNFGTVDNFNDILMNHIHTSKVMMLGADNYLRPDALELMNKVEADIVSSDIALIGTEAEVFSKTDKKITEKKDGYLIWRFVKRDIERNNYIHGSSLYNVDKAKKFGYKGVNDKYPCEDWMLFKAMLRDGATHKHISEPLLFYRRHKHNFYPIQV